MKSSIATRITAAIVAIMAVTVLLTAYLNFAKFNSALGKLERDRYGVLFFDLRDTIERSLKLGASLSALRNTQDVLERLRELDNQILDITVYDPTGTVVFSTNLVSGKQIVPAAWATYAKSTSSPVWSAEEEQNVLIGTALKNAFDQPVGGLALTYSKRSSVHAANTVFKSLGKYAIGVTLLLCIVSAFAFTVYLRTIAASLARIAEWIKPLTFRSNTPTPTLVPSNAIEEAVAQYVVAADATLKHLEGSMEELNSLEVKV